MNKHQKALKAKNLLEEKLVALKKIVFDMCTDEYNAKVFTRNYTTLKDIINQYKNVIDDIDNLIEKYCKEEKGVKNKVNKYQEALNRIAKYCSVNNGSMLEDDLKTLQELSDKLIPKKVKVWSFVNARGKYIDVYYCDSCNQSIDRIKYENHCFNCGQALDWSEY